MSEEIKDTRKIWLVEHPTYQYEQDVKQLARRNDLVIVDARFADRFDDDQLAKGPKLTVKKEFLPVVEDEGKKEG